MRIHINIFQHFVIIRERTFFGKFYRFSNRLFNSRIDILDLFLRGKFIIINIFQKSLDRISSFVFLQLVLGSVFSRIADRMSFVTIGFHF